MSERTTIAFLLALILLPVSVSGATLRADESVAVSESPAGNAYLAGTEVRIDAPLPGDLLAASGNLQIHAPIKGDALVLAGTIGLSSPVAGDMRAGGGRIRIDGDVGGELALFGGVITVTGNVHEVRAAGATVELRSGADGPVTIYGANVLLAGEFSGDVRVVASDHVTLEEGTIIHGTFDYNAPQEAGIPSSAVVDGGVHYIGSSSFLPTTAEARTFALAGLGIFFIVRLVAVILATGLVTGLFPEFARRVTNEVLGRSFKRSALLTLLGFCVFVATPVLLLLLLISFVGIGIAILLATLYVLLLLLSYLYGAVLIGSAFMRFVMKREKITWKGAVLGMFILNLISLLPIVGPFIAFILSSTALGALLLIFYRFAFTREGNRV